ncbi:unnamed protein product [Oppiella nova]|uniref:SCP domain-containing protein n=1 Tax=Oppiella nova TaxID=334625 RepID=A0A7R9MG48_9ACAR|nr:unnamed protein product [Oppiella nova]CAG2176580.1 unnamed protein product [Oppiella nova]
MDFKIFIILFVTMNACLARNPMDDKTDDDFLNDCIHKSNELRARHHSPGYDEVHGYNYDTGEGAGHFTQLVWKSSTGLGCARCAGREPGGAWYETYVVCNYKPQGNIVTDDKRYYHENVLRP